MAGLQDMRAIESRLILNMIVEQPIRDAASAASHPA
jgi:hypothetical protein